MGEWHLGGSDTHGGVAFRGGGVALMEVHSL